MPLPEESAALSWLKQEQVEDASSWLAFAGGAPLLAQEYANSERGTRIKQVVGLLKQGNRDALLAWPVTEREQMEVLSEVLQKWAYDQALKGKPGGGRFFGASAGKAVDSSVWLRFAREAGRYRLAARHPLNPKQFAADLIGRMPD